MRPILATLLVVFGFAMPLSAGSAEAEMTVSAYVVPRIDLTVTPPLSELVVTEADVRRGFIDVPAPLLMQLRSNLLPGSLLRFAPLSPPFARARVSWEDTTVVAGAEETWVRVGYRKGLRQMASSVRLELEPGAEPGRYRWPVQITASAI